MVALAKVITKVVTSVRSSMMLASLVSALKFDGINPAPDMTKRKTALKLIT